MRGGKQIEAGQEKKQREGTGEWMRKKHRQLSPAVSENKGCCRHQVFSHGSHPPGLCSQGIQDEK